MAVRANGASQSSPSRNRIALQSSASAPRLRAADTPALGWEINRNRGSEKPRTTRAVSSVEPSSTTTIDQSWCV